MEVKNTNLWEHFKVVASKQFRFMKQKIRLFYEKKTPKRSYSWLK